MLMLPVQVLLENTDFQGDMGVTAHFPFQHCAARSHKTWATLVEKCTNSGACVPESTGVRHTSKCQHFQWWGAHTPLNFDVLMARCTWGGGGQGQSLIRRNLNGVGNWIHSPLLFMVNRGNPHSSFPWKNSSHHEDSFTTGGSLVHQKYVFLLLNVLLPWCVAKVVTYTD